MAISVTHSKMMYSWIKKFYVSAFMLFIFSGTATAGVNEWTSGSADDFPFTAVAVDPSSSAIVYAGTTASGIHKSRNAGTTWAAANTGLTSNYISSIVIDPNTPATIYAGAHTGIFKSTNRGAEWTDISNGLTNLYVDALVIDPSDSTILYAGTQGGVFKSTDGGSNWDDSSTGLSTDPEHHIVALVIDPISTSTIYAGTLSTGVFKSTNSGTSWDNFSTGLTNLFITALAIDPSSPGTLYAGTATGIWKSVNGGTSWAPLNATSLIHIKDIAVDPDDSNIVYAGTADSGVLRSTDGGVTWPAVNEELGDLNVQTLAIDPSYPNTVYAGTGTEVYDITFCSNGDTTCPPDLRVKYLSNPPLRRKSGGSFTVTDRLTNTGYAKAGRSTTRYYLSLDNRLQRKTDVLLAGSRNVPYVLGKSTSGLKKTTVTIPVDTAPGRYYVIACADNGRKVTESKEFNNCRVTTTKIRIIN